MKFYVIVLILLLYCRNYGEGFVAGTLVKTPTGYKPIEQIYIGDTVSTYDCASLVSATVMAIKEKNTCLLIRIILNNGQEIIADYDQLFYVIDHNEWIPADQLTTSGRCFLSGSTQHLCIDQIHYTQECAQVYDLILDRCHIFLVSTDQIRVHNFVQKVAKLIWYACKGIEYWAHATGELASWLAALIKIFT